MAASQPQEGNLRRCGRCTFVYPGERRLLDDPIHHDLDVVPADRYRIVRPLRSHGAGRVYLARHLRLDAPCVLKILSRVDPAYSREALERFIEEAKAGFRIKHPNVARVLDFDRTGDEWYFVMEFVDGINLGEAVRTCHRFSWTQVVDMARQTADGLAAVHTAGLLHRDIKPSNLLLCPDGSVRIADLGLVAFLGGSPAGVGKRGPLFGTPPYMSPEHRENQVALDQRTDIYALGATMFHLLVGHPPRREGQPLDYLTGGDRHAPVEWPRDIIPPPPNWLREVVDRCLSPDREQRFGSATALRDELNDWIKPTDVVIGGHQIPGIGNPKGLAVLPFENLTGSATDDWVSTALAEEIHQALQRIPGTYLVDRREVLTLLGRMYAEQGITTTTAQMLDAARRAGAAAVIRGNIQHRGSRIMLTAVRYDSEHVAGRMLARVTGVPDDIFELQAALAERVVEALGYHRQRSDTSGPAPTMSRAGRRACAVAERAFSSGRYHAAIKFCADGLIRDPDSVELLSLMGVCHSRIGQFDQAIACHRQAESLAEQRNDPFRLVEATGNLGVTYYFKEEFSLAYDLMQKANGMAANLNLLSLLARSCNNMGFLLMRMERLTEADEAFGEAIRLKLSLGATSSLVTPFNGRGDIALSEGRYQDALEFYGQALEWAERTRDTVNIGLCHKSLGRCQRYLGNLEAALSHLDRAVDTLTGTEFYSGVNAAWEQLAEVHLSRGSVQAAFECIEKRVELAQRHRNRQMEAAAWEQKARAYELDKQKDAAMECLRKSIQLQQLKSPFDPPRPAPPTTASEFGERAER